MATTKDPQRWADLGGWIADRRKQIGMDQRQLAEAAGVSENTISNYERGRVPARGKVPAGYYRVERALKFGKGSIDAILAGYEPNFAVEGAIRNMMRLREPDEVDDPIARELIPIIAEALRYEKMAIMLADLADRWNASPEAIERFKEATSELVADMFAPGHGPANAIRLQELARARRKESEPDPLELRPDLGWTAYAVDLVEAEGRNEVGDVLRKARQAAGITAEELSTDSRIPERVINLIEANDFSFPGAFMHAPVYISLLAEKLGLDADRLVEDFRAARTELEQGV